MSKKFEYTMMFHIFCSQKIKKVIYKNNDWFIVKTKFECNRFECMQMYGDKWKFKITILFTSFHYQINTKEIIIGWWLQRKCLVQINCNTAEVITYIKEVRFFWTVLWNVYWHFAVLENARVFSQVICLQSNVS